MRSVAQDEDMPSRSAIRAALEKSDAFQNQYVRACDERAEKLFEEIVDIADDGTNDYMTRTRDDGTEYEVVNHEHIQRSRLRIDARKWMLGKMKPKKYGDKVEIDTDAPVNMVIRLGGDAE